MICIFAGILKKIEEASQNKYSPFNTAAYIRTQHKPSHFISPA
jgi:hypothetical protein